MIDLVLSLLSSLRKSAEQLEAWTSAFGYKTNVEVRADTAYSSGGRVD